MIGAVILAAGAGARMGGVAKALLPSPRGDEGGRTFLGAIVQIAARAGVAPDAIVIVVGAPHGDAVAREAARLGLAGHTVWNDDPARGMASSVAIGFEALPDLPHLHAALLWPVDHPAVLASTIEALDDALARGDAVDAAVPTFGPDGRGGHPTLVAHALWPAMARCDRHADGARGVLRAARVIRVAVDDPGVRRDVDVPADLEALS